MPKDVKFNIKLTIDGKEQIVTASTSLKKFSEELEIARSESHNHQGLCVHRLAGIWRSSLLFCRVRHLQKSGPGFLFVWFGHLKNQVPGSENLSLDLSLQLGTSFFFSQYFGQRVLKTVFLSLLCVDGFLRNVKNLSRNKEAEQRGDPNDVRDIQGRRR